MPESIVTNAYELAASKAHYVPLVSVDGSLSVSLTQIVKIDMGAVVTADANGFIVSQDLTTLGVFSVSATAAVAIAAAALAGIADVPRNVVAAWTGTAILTVTGTDVYGEVMSESSASGTSFTGKKAFKNITDISVSADVTALTVGTGVVLGIPFVLTGEYDVLAFYADTTEEKLAATFAAAVGTTASATTGDVRGTVSPDTTPDSSVHYYLWMHVQATSTVRGLMGITQA